MKQSKYNAEYALKLVEHMREGNSYDSFGAMINVTTKTMENWEKKYPAWQLAKEMGKQHELKYWENLLMKGAVGDLPSIKKRVTVFDKDKNVKQVTIIDEPGKFNATSVIFALKNKFPKLYREQIQIQNTGENIDNLSPEEITKRKLLYASLVNKK